MAGFPAELGRVDAGLNLELLQRVDRRQDGVSVEIHIGVVNSIQREIVEILPLAGNRYLLFTARAAHTPADRACVSEADVHIGAYRH